MQHGGDVCAAERWYACMRTDWEYRWQTLLGFYWEACFIPSRWFCFHIHFRPFSWKVRFSSEIFFAGAISLWTWWHTMPSSVPQSGVSNLRDIQLLGRSRGGPWGRMWGQRTRCATSQAWCHGAQLFSNGREGCQKQLIYATNNRTRIARTLTPGTRRPLWKHETAHGICLYAFYATSISYSAFHCETIICPTLTIALNSWRETSPSNTMPQGVSQRCFKKRLWYL